MSNTKQWPEAGTARRTLFKPRQPPPPWWLRGELRGMWGEIESRVERLPTRLNEYGYDPFGYDPSLATRFLLPALFFHRLWFRVESRGVENVPAGRVLLIGNHAGNTFAFDGAMLSTALFMDAEPPRIARGMAEYFLPTIPFFNVFMVRAGSVVYVAKELDHRFVDIEEDLSVLAFFATPRDEE